MAKAAQADKLRAAFEKHHGETEGQVERLERIFELLDKPARGKTCDAIQGILDEGKEIMEERRHARSTPVCWRRLRPSSMRFHATAP
jgi:ferritin-like metal-binding protein YciE